jgi:hypothetical protein
MIWSTPALQDTTIYENDPYRNAGLDPILEIKAGQDSNTLEYFEARSLIKFDIASVKNMFISEGYSGSFNAKLILHTVQELEIPPIYTLKCYPVADSWSDGTGYATEPDGTVPESYLSDGATWYLTNGNQSLTWVSASMSSDATVAYNSVSGGGDWYSAWPATQSFSYKSTDSIAIDVTSAVNQWLSASINNNGFIIGLNNPFSYNTVYNTTIQLYSSETHTVYEPHLYIYWNADVFNSGSNVTASFSDNTVVYVNALKSEYQQNTKAMIQLGARPRYPRRTFSQNTDFSTVTILPETSYYQIRDAHSNEIVIPYSDFTKVSASDGINYISFYTTMLYPERFYSFEIKTTYMNGVTEYYNGSDFIFKITQ